MVTLAPNDCNLFTTRGLVVSGTTTDTSISGMLRATVVTANPALPPLDDMIFIFVGVDSSVDDDDDVSPFALYLYTL